MFDHMGVYVANLERSRRFYEAVLAPLGFALLEDNQAGDSRWLVFGTGETDPFFVISYAPDRPLANRIHVGFVASSTAAVDAFHRSGLEAGGTDNGPPGPRPGKTPYYGAYLIDPDGNNVEAGYRGELAQTPSAS